MRAFLLTCALVVLSSGCANHTLKLEPRWAPLEQVVETTDRIIPSGTTMTVGSTCYTNSLTTWLSDYPPGSVQQEALLLHEQIHAKRQLTWPGSIAVWVSMYLTSSDFQWAEEQYGWKAEITHLVLHNVFVNAEGLAYTLSHDYNHMVSYEKALAWVRTTISEAWK